MTRAKGFTLIELLVVIAIIGVLSSVVLASLNSARQRANTAAMKAQAQELRKVFQQHYFETGTYTGLYTGSGWIGSAGTTCEARNFAGTYGAQALQICNRISEIAPRSDYKFYLGVNTASYSLANNFSIMLITDTGTMTCFGSSGAVSADVAFTGSSYTLPGCFSNP